MWKHNLLLVVVLLLEASRGFPFEDATSGPFAEDDYGNETRRCYWENIPVFFKRCSLGSQAFREAMLECARDLQLNLPCDMQKMASDELLDCVDDEEAFQKFSQDANDKCYDGCIVRRLHLVTEDGQHDLGRILEFVSSLPILEGRGLDEQEKNMVQECLTNSSSSSTYSPGYGPKAEQKGERSGQFCAVMGNAIACAAMPIEEKYALCIDKMCQEISEAAA